MSDPRSDHASNPDQLMARALGVCWHSPTSDRWPCQEELPMTPVPSSPVALLDQLDELRAKATADMPWRQDSGWGENILGASGEAIGGVEFPSDAALIVGAVNALPDLIADLRKHHAAVRATAELADELDAKAGAYLNSDLRRNAYTDAADRIRAALSVTP